MTETKSIELNILLAEEIKNKAKSMNKLLKDFTSLKDFQVFEIVETKCDRFHLSDENFQLLNQLHNRELTILDGKTYTDQEYDKRINDNLRELIEKAIQRKEHPDKWPDYNKCPFRKKLDEISGQCLKDSPDKRWSITASDCWACIARGKMNRQREGQYTAHEYIEKLGTPTVSCPKIIENNRCSIDRKICNPTDCAQYYWMKKGEGLNK